MNIVVGCKALITGTLDSDCVRLVGSECEVIGKLTDPDNIAYVKSLGINDPENVWNIFVPSVPNGDFGSHEKHLLRIDGNKESFEKEQESELILEN